MTRPPRAMPVRDAVVAEQHGLDVRACRRRSTRRRPTRRATAAGVAASRTPSSTSSARATRGAVPGRDLEPRPAQVGGHRRPHRAQPDEPDPLHASPPAVAARVPVRDPVQIRCGDGMARGGAAAAGHRPAGLRPDRDGPGGHHRRRPDRRRHRGAQPRRPDRGRPGEAERRRSTGSTPRSTSSRTTTDHAAATLNTTGALIGEAGRRDPGPRRRLGRARRATSTSTSSASSRSPARRRGSATSRRRAAHVPGDDRRPRRTTSTTNADDLTAADRRDRADRHDDRGPRRRASIDFDQAGEIVTLMVGGIILGGFLVAWLALARGVLRVGRLAAPEIAWPRPPYGAGSADGSA